MDTKLKYVLLAVVMVCGPMASSAIGADAPSTNEMKLVAGRSAVENELYDVAETELGGYLSGSGMWQDNLEKPVLLYLRSLYELGRSSEIIKALKNRRLFKLKLPARAPFVYWLALAYFDTGQADEALKILAGFEAKYGDKGEFSWRVQRLRAWCNLKAGNIDEALANFRSFAQVQKNSPEYAVNLLEYGQVLAATNRFDDAVVVLRDLANMPGDQREIREGRFLLGKVLMRQQKWKEGVDILKPLCVDEKAGSELRAEAWFATARAHSAQGSTDQAIAAMKSGIALARGDELKKRANLILGEYLLKSGMLDEGIPLLRTFISASPDDPRAAEYQLVIGSAFLDRDKNAEAVKEFQRYLETFTNSAGQAIAYYGRGWGLFRTSQFAEAASSFSKACSIFKERGQKEKSLLKCADAHFANGQYKTASETYAQFLKEFKDSGQAPAAICQHAESFARLGDAASARKMFQDLIKAHPRSQIAEEAYLRLGFLETEQNRPDEAIKAFDSLINTYSNTTLKGDAQYGRGMVRVRQKKVNEALADLEQVMKNFPGTRVAEHSAYERAVCFQWLGREKETVAAFGEFLKRFPQSSLVPDVLFWQAQNEFNRGNREVASKQLMDFAAKYKDHPLAPEALLRAGISACERKEYLKAIEILGSMAKNYPNSRKLADGRFVQGNAQCELGYFADAILLFDEIINKYPDSDLIMAAWGRKGDCHFTLGGDDPKRYEESIRCYAIVIGSSKSSREMVLQAQFKTGRSLVKLLKTKEALDCYYSRVMVPFLQEVEKGIQHSDAEKMWFTRAAMGAAALLENEKDLKRVVKILEMLVEAGVPGSDEARERIKKIKTENWWVFY